MAVWPINTLHPVHREEEAWLNTRWVCKLIVSKSVRCFIELLILRSQAEKHPIYVQHGAAGLHLARLHRSLSDGQEHLVLRRELVLQVPVLLQGFQHSDPMTGATGSVCPRPPSTSSSRGVFSHTHTHTGVSLAFLTGRSFHLTPPCALL